MSLVKSENQKRVTTGSKGNPKNRHIYDQGYENELASGSEAFHTWETGLSTEQRSFTWPTTRLICIIISSGQVNFNFYRFVNHP